MKLVHLIVARILTGACYARDRPDGGMSTAEYAVGTVAACGFAALLFKILTSSQVRQLLVGLVKRALNLAG
ncbi:MAG: DUF4244 domain-containing protein [Actinobacteria bacterium]|nr:DUF4244 domain-containing protein [Actinomycetota bacterium]